MKKIILALLVSASFIASAKADDATTTKAAEFAATYIVYSTQCKLAEEVKNQLAGVVKMYITAAGEANRLQILALTRIKIVELEDEAKQVPNYCKMMAAAFKQGQQ